MKPCSIGWINLSQPVSQILKHQMQWCVCVGGSLHQHQSNSHTGPFYCFPKNTYLTSYLHMITVTKQDGKASSSSFSKQLTGPSHRLEIKLVPESANRSCSIQDKSNKTSGFPINACRAGAATAAAARTGASAITSAGPCTEFQHLPRSRR